MNLFKYIPSLIIVIIIVAILLLIGNPDAPPVPKEQYRV